MLNDLCNNKILFFVFFGRRNTMYRSHTWDTRVADNGRVNENCSKPFRGYPCRITHDDNDVLPPRPTP